MRPKLLSALLMILLCRMTAAGRSEEGTTVQIRAILGALDRCKISGPAGNKFVIAIVHDKSVPADTVAAVRSAFDENKSVRVKGLPISTMALPFESRSDLKKQLQAIGARAIFLTEGNERIVRDVLSATRALKIVSTSNVPDYVHWMGVTLGVEAEEGEAMKIMVNLASCQHEKVKFDEGVLENASIYF